MYSPIDTTTLVAELFLCIQAPVSGQHDAPLDSLLLYLQFCEICTQIHNKNFFVYSSHNASNLRSSHAWYRCVVGISCRVVTSISDDSLHAMTVDRVFNSTITGMYLHVVDNVAELELPLLKTASSVPPLGEWLPSSGSHHTLQYHQ